MARFIITTFVFLGFAFYQMSGGSQFDPVETRNARIDAPAEVETVALASAPPTTETPEVEVTRVSLELASVQDVLTPQRNLRTEVARNRAVVEDTAIDAAVEEALVEDTSSQITLPSLIENATSAEATVTPVDFSDTTTPAPVPTTQDVRSVTGSRVNVRGGPGTNFNVVNSLSRGTRVEVLEDPGNGWVRLRPVDGGPAGWMADFLLSEG